MLTLLSDTEIKQLQAYTVEILGIAENINLLIGQAQSIETDPAVRTNAVPQEHKTLRVSDTSTGVSHSKSRASSRKGQRGVSVLNTKKVADIRRQLLTGGKTVAVLAREYRVHTSTINCIKWNKTWKQVQPSAVGTVKPLEIMEIRK
jgi:anti-sigma28 factor (negative regulator of flagellin synthesis)